MRSVPPVPSPRIVTLVAATNERSASYWPKKLPSFASISAPSSKMIYVLERPKRGFVTQGVFCLSTIIVLAPELSAACRKRVESALSKPKLETLTLLAYAPVVIAAAVSAKIEILFIVDFTFF